jgi:type IV secretion system protein VirB3
LTEQLLVAGAPRGMIVMNFCLAAIFIMALHFIWILPLNIAIHCGAVYVNKSDDQFFDALRRFLNKKKYYST